MFKPGRVEIVAKNSPDHVKLRAIARYLDKDDDFHGLSRTRESREVQEYLEELAKFLELHPSALWSA